ncbi:MAG: copper amine oxidase N-terminal domain-containing protein [Clostridiales bacterium]|jgi:hypothetical protein|nr:copper amine oxidase N-terminal domain-containing protein [Clostridiales bacterium]
MKIKKFIISLITGLAVALPAVSSFAAIGTGPDGGTYVITNNANNLELTVNASNQPVLNNSSGVSWKLTEAADYYSITTSDGKASLAYSSSSGVYLAIPNASDVRQHWLVSAVTGGYVIESLANWAGSGVPAMGATGDCLYSVSAGISVPGTIGVHNVASIPALTAQDIWNGAAPPAQTATPTPTGPSLPKAPKPISDPANGSYIRGGDKITLKNPGSFPNGNVYYSLIDPASGTVTWYPASTTINTPNSGTLHVWAKITRKGYQDSDIEHFIFYVQRGSATPTPTPKPTITVTPTPTPVRPGPLTQVVLKVSMNKLQYTVNGASAMFDVAPYLDTKANRSMIPMRFIAEAFGASVYWDDATKTQTISLNGKTFKITNNVPLPDGMGTPVLKQDRFFVPLRYVSQELGASVDWDNATSTNTIVYYK